MKKSIVLLALLAMLIIANSLNAQTVGRAYDAGSLQTAMMVSADGDIIMLKGNLHYGNIILNKRLILTGPGYFLTNYNTPRQNLECTTRVPAKFGYITLTARASGSIIQGVEVDILSNYNFQTDRYQNIDNVVIRRNSIVNLTLALPDSNAIYNNGWNIEQNYVSHAHLWKAQGSIVKNNIVGDLDFGYSNGISVMNNTILGQVWCERNSSISFSNNILESIYSYDVMSNDLITHNNVFTQTNGENNHPIDYGQGNIEALSGSIFKEGENFDRWKLAPNSPAIGAGVDGGDCGAFWGNWVYVLHDIPGASSLPTTAAGNNGTTIQETINIEGHK